MWWICSPPPAMIICFSSPTPARCTARRAIRSPLRAQQTTKIHYLNKQSPSFKASCPVKKEQLELLVNQGMTMKQIGEQLNVSINTIRKWFNTFKVETPYQKNRKITETIDLQEFSRLIELGTS